MTSFVPQENQKRKKIVAILGSECDLSVAVRKLGIELTRHYGGVFIAFGDGFWSSLGNSNISDYPRTSIVQENALRIELLIMPEEEISALTCLKNIIKNINSELGLKCRFVHIEISPAIAAHIDLSNTT